ncbi:MAG: 2-oxo acid dehydrogenase subunit E2, partial [Candidatus Kapabacteria bacterium]|nr:2-oxo acid dehydrogenase subunit E2 [Candidatus Kapabacteria bacterium]
MHGVLLSVNDAYVRELYAQYVLDPESVPLEWQQYFERYGDGHSQKQLPVPHAPAESAVPPGATSQPLPWLLPTDELFPLEGSAERIAQNMERSLLVPTATSFRVVPIKLLEENRWLANRYLQRRGQPKLSFTHLLAWAVLQGLKRYPHLNDACATIGGKLYRVRRRRINLGIAVDVVRKDGSRSLVVPNIQDAQSLTFSEFVIRYEELVQRA